MNHTDFSSNFSAKTRAGAQAALLALALAVPALPAAAQASPEGADFSAPASSVGAVFSSTNSALGNAVLMFRQDKAGRLTPIGTYFTGGRGTGGGLSNAGALAFSADRRFLYVVDAGSSDIAVFAVSKTKMSLLGRIPSGGTTPVSLAVHGSWLYVLNADTISGFFIGRSGGLTPLPGSTRNLSGASTGAAQVGFSPSGEQLVVTERATNKIDVYPVNADGLAGTPVVTPSIGATPFGFDFDPAGRLIVSEAFGGAAGRSAVSSYLVSDFGSLPVTGSAPDGQSAACWIAVSRGGAYAWTTNTGSGTVSAYDVSPGGRLTLTESGGVVADTGAGSKPTDMALDPSGRYLYVLESASGAVAAFRVNRNGTLAALGTAGSVGPGATGLLVF